jgi:threonine dehydrogenase-like Zn-dependent dehydrogenase
LNREVSAVLEAPEKMRLTEFPVPEIRTDEMLLRVERVSVCGSDPKYYLGKHEIQVYPKILGHEVVGYVEKAGETAAKIYNVKEGERVTVEPFILCGNCRYCLTGYYQLCKRRRCYGVNLSCSEPPYLWGAYGQYMYVSPGSRVHKIAPGVSPEAACLSSVIGNGIRWVQTKAEVKPGESVVIVGPGAQGLSTVIAAVESGADPIIVLGLSKDSQKLELANQFGAHHILNLEDTDPVSFVRDVTTGEMADVVIECAGSISAIQLGLDLVKPLGRYVLTGKSGWQAIPLITDKIVSNEIRLLGGYGQSWNVEQAVRVINSGRYGIERMITHVFALNKAEEAIRFFIENPDKCIRVAIDPNLRT